MGITKESRLPRKAVLIAVAVVLFGVFLTLGIVLPHLGNTVSIHEPEYSQTIAIGDEIIKALEAYKSDHGRYPTSLNALVPAYLQEIKAPTWGIGAWNYVLLKPNEEYFILRARVKEKNRPGLYYDSSTWKKWYYESR